LLARIDPGLKERLSRLAAQRGCFEARLVTDALSRYLDDEGKRASRGGKR
jgi:hypothetical protein